MNLEQASLEKLRVLPREKQQEVFLFCWRNSAKEEDIVQARKELWGISPGRMSDAIGSGRSSRIDLV